MVTKNRTSGSSAGQKRPNPSPAESVRGRDKVPRGQSAEQGSVQADTTDRHEGAEPDYAFLMEYLQDGDQLKQLEIIDRLREMGVGEEISLPQVSLCQC